MRSWGLKSFSRKLEAELGSHAFRGAGRRQGRSEIQRGNGSVNTSVTNLPLQEEVTTERINLSSKQL